MSPFPKGMFYYLLTLTVNECSKNHFREREQKKSNLRKSKDQEKNNKPTGVTNIKQPRLVKPNMI